METLWVTGKLWLVEMFQGVFRERYGFLARVYGGFCLFSFFLINKIICMQILQGWWHDSCWYWNCTFWELSYKSRGLVSSSITIHCTEKICDYCYSWASEPLQKRSNGKQCIFGILQIWQSLWVRFCLKIAALLRSHSLSGIAVWTPGSKILQIPSYLKGRLWS